MPSRGEQESTPLITEDHLELRRVLDELSEIRLVDVVLATRIGINIRRCCVSRPTEHQQILLDHLGLKLPTRIIQN